MISLKQWISTLFEPQDLQYKEGKLDEIRAALQNHEVQKRWLDSMIEKLQGINMEIDSILDKEDKTRIWETFAIERRTLIACLRMILDAKDSIESDRFEQETQTRLFERYRGIAAPIDLLRKSGGQS